MSHYKKHIYFFLFARLNFYNKTHIIRVFISGTADKPRVEHVLGIIVLVINSNYVWDNRWTKR